MDALEIIKTETKELLAKVDVEVEPEVTAEEEGYSVLLDSKDNNALLIGRHGDTLSSLELIVSLMVAKKTGEYKRVSFEIGDYRKEREEYLKNLAEKLKQDVISTGYEKTIRGLKPWERRSVHLMFQEDQEVTTESTGEGRDRVLVIKKK